jgi:glucokinase
MMLGLEFLDGGAIGVIVDQAGQVCSRAEASGAKPAEAVSSVLAKLLPPPLPAEVGIAAISPESPAILEALTTLARQVPGAPRIPVSSGVGAVAAEAWVGAARGAKDVVYFAIADHTSAGILRNGAPLTGSKGRAASAAWLALNPVEREDYRRVGCLEAEVSASGIVRRMIWRIKAGDQSTLTDAVAGDLAAVSVDHILDAARKGDGVAVSVIRDTAKYLGMAAANLVVVTDPEVLVLGGIMASAADLLLEPVRTEIGRRLPGGMMQALAIRTAALGADAPAIGAARLAAAAAQ